MGDVLFGVDGGLGLVLFVELLLLHGINLISYKMSD